ncbi:hypothetical protein F4780DRAFT_740599, partial [Xylariomycetidae sp. FL0641]
MVAQMAHLSVEGPPCSWMPSCFFPTLRSGSGRESERRENGDRTGKSWGRGHARLSGCEEFLACGWPDVVLLLTQAELKVDLVLVHYLPSSCMLMRLTSPNRSRGDSAGVYNPTGRAPTPPLTSHSLPRVLLTYPRNLQCFPWPQASRDGSLLFSVGSLCLSGGIAGRQDVFHPRPRPSKLSMGVSRNTKPYAREVALFSRANGVHLMSTLRLCFGPLLYRYVGQPQRIG